jgi:hypothetical protein
MGAVNWKSSECGTADKMRHPTHKRPTQFFKKEALLNDASLSIRLLYWIFL